VRSRLTVERPPDFTGELRRITLDPLGTALRMSRNGRRLADHRTAIGIHVGFIFVMIHAPPNAISPAYTICGSIAMSAEMSPTIAAPHRHSIGGNRHEL
jgi:hypothetical protein